MWSVFERPPERPRRERSSSAGGASHASGGSQHGSLGAALHRLGSLTTRSLRELGSQLGNLLPQFHPGGTPRAARQAEQQAAAGAASAPVSPRRPRRSRFSFDLPRTQRASLDAPALARAETLPAPPVQRTPAGVVIDAAPLYKAHHHHSPPKGIPTTIAEGAWAARRRLRWRRVCWPPGLRAALSPVPRPLLAAACF